ncbi:uncharacterized protein BKA78DRAFT_115428 [Phyllosticta capitalensis]|uniref:uncharacterized protein n=1 Tax=Phyllosticta capitalensis TaxID=121624 RepID=UPI00312DA122
MISTTCPSTCRVLDRLAGCLSRSPSVRPTDSYLVQNSDASGSSMRRAPRHSGNDFQDTWNHVEMKELGNPIAADACVAVSATMSWTDSTRRVALKSRHLPRPSACILSSIGGSVLDTKLLQRQANCSQTPTGHVEQVRQIDSQRLSIHQYPWPRRKRSQEFGRVGRGEKQEK